MNLTSTKHITIQLYEDRNITSNNEPNFNKMFRSPLLFPQLGPLLSFPVHSPRSPLRQLKKRSTHSPWDFVSSWWMLVVEPTHLKNMRTVKLDHHETPRIEVKITKKSEGSIWFISRVKIFETTYKMVNVSH